MLAPSLGVLNCREQGKSLIDRAAGVWSLAYIGTASITEFGLSLRIDPRRFRLGDEKEAAGGGDAVIQAGIMDFEYGLGMK